jgi:hypothetical protein
MIVGIQPSLLQKGNHFEDNQITRLVGVFLFFCSEKVMLPEVYDRLDHLRPARGSGRNQGVHGAHTYQRMSKESAASSAAGTDVPARTSALSSASTDRSSGLSTMTSSSFTPSGGDLFVCWISSVLVTFVPHEFIAFLLKNAFSPILDLFKKCKSYTFNLPPFD